MKFFSFIILFALTALNATAEKRIELKKQKFYKEIFALNPKAIEKNIKISGNPSKAEEISKITFDNANVSDFSPLEACEKLFILIIKNGKNIDIGTIAKIKHLRHLEITNSSLVNLKGFSNLRDLAHKDAKFYDTGTITLHNCQLNNEQAKIICDNINPYGFDFSKNPGITDLSFLENKKFLGILRINDTGVSDLTPIKKTNFSILEINTPAVQDLSPIFGKNLYKLRISRELKDITQVKKIPKLKEIAIGEDSFLPQKEFWAKIDPDKSNSPPKLPSFSPKEVKKEKEEDKYAKLQKDAKEKINFKFSNVKNNLVIVEHDKGCGSGFIAKDKEGNAYIYTNQHVVFGAKRLSFKTLNGEKLKPVGFDLSQERDLIRFKLEEYPEALEFNETPVMDEPVAVFGNSAGGGVATEIFGKVTGIGADRIEVSARFVQGNSGSPIFDKDKKVLGMATYVMRSMTKGDWVKKGTRFEDPRYFAYKIDDNVNWKKIKWKTFQRLGQKIQQDKDGIDEILKLAKTWLKAPYTSIEDGDFKQQDIRTWIKKHNSMAQKHQKQKDKGYVRNARKLGKINQAIREDLEENYKSFSDLCNRRCKAITFKTKRYKKYLTKYMKNEIEQNQAALKFLGEKIEEIGGKIATTDAFYLRNSPY